MSTQPAILAVLPLGAPLLAGQKRTELASPPAPSLARASAYLDRAERDLDNLLQESRNGDRAKITTALEAYARVFSKLHVELGQLPAGKQERGFVSGLADRLRLHFSRLNEVAENGQPELKSGLLEASHHVKSALQLAESKLREARGRGWLKLDFSGQRSASRPPGPIVR